jgi:tRNA pseudouridine38-40 synthase
MQVRVELTWDGAGLHGWQHQPGVLTVQGALQDVLARLDHAPVAVSGASRTDAGVHARGQVAAFTLQVPRSTEAIFRALNQGLPSGIGVQRVEVCDGTFHPRHHARGKIYRYTLQEGWAEDPLMRGRAWHVRGQLDVEAMERAGSLLEGRHDFSSFRASGCDASSPVRTLWRVQMLRPSPGQVVIEVAGTSFLKYMVRNLAGTLVEVGLGRRTPGWAGEVLAARDRRLGGMTAPPWGLVLEHICYPRHPWQEGRRISPWDGRDGAWVAWVESQAAQGGERPAAG